MCDPASYFGEVGEDDAGDRGEFREIGLTENSAVVIDAFRAVGLSDDCRRTWRIIYDCPYAALPDLCAATSLDESAVRECVRSLIDVGFLRTCDEGPLRVRCADPSVVIETHLIRREREAAQSAAELVALRSLVHPLFEEFQRGGSLGSRSTSFEVIESIDEIRRELYAAVDRVRSDIRTLDPGALSEERNLAIMQPAIGPELEVLARGVRDRSILDARILSDPALVAIQAEFRSHGALVRTMPDVPCRVTILDRALALVAIEPRFNKGAILIRVPSLIDSLIFMFDGLWPTAQPVFELDDSDVPTPRGPRILEFMAAGMKDEKIARALGVGPRTIRRDIYELKESLGVSSRTEIVAAAARRGWL